MCDDNLRSDMEKQSRDRCKPNPITELVRMRVSYPTPLSIYLFLLTLCVSLWLAFTPVVH